MPRRVKLSEIADALQGLSDEHSTYLDLESGKVIHVMHELSRIFEDEDADAEEELADMPQWQREEAAVAKAIEEDDGSRFISLPSKFDINEWDMMREFVDQVEDDALAERLSRAIHGSGAFRYFKNVIHEAGIQNDWYKFKDDQYRQIALDWCQANQIDIDAEDPPVQGPQG